MLLLNKKKAVSLLVLTSIVAVILFAFGNIAFGQNGDPVLLTPPGGAPIDYQPLSPLPGAENITTTEEYLKTVFRTTIGIAAVLAVLMIVIGGLQYMTSEAIGDKQSAKDKMTYAIWGLLLAIASVLILQTINPQLLELDFTTEKFILVPLSGGGNGSNGDDTGEPGNGDVIGPPPPVERFVHIVCDTTSCVCPDPQPGETFLGNLPLLTSQCTYNALDPNAPDFVDQSKINLCCRYETTP